MDCSIMEPSPYSVLRYLGEEKKKIRQHTGSFMTVTVDKYHTELHEAKLI